MSRPLNGPGGQANALAATSRVSAIVVAGIVTRASSHVDAPLS
jgi:hypothetical protein